MAEPSTMARQVWGVGALLLAMGDALAARFGACSVRGELSGFTRAASGHCYFTLKDADGQAAALRCAMFRRAASLVDFNPRDGQQVELRGRIALYEPRGELQFVVESMQLVGTGSLYEQFLRLKERLQAQGLFDAERKRALPRFPARVGVVTSLAAAALRDVLTTLARRAPQVEVVIYPSPVQGAEAPAALVAALQLANQRREVDVLILCRGGGSLEDLWAFNDERVVFAVAESGIPLVCGVGHETDVSLADFAADLRAPTPTAAAELVAPSQAEALEQLSTLARRMRRQVQRQLERQAQDLDQRALQLARPGAVLARHAQQLDRLEERARHALRHALLRAAEAPQRLAARLERAQGVQRERAAVRLQALAARLLRAQQTQHQRTSLTLQGMEQRLAALDPHRVLSRGYAWVTNEAGQPIVSARALQPGQQVQAVWSDGRALAQVLKVQPED
ncbi:exodeoxyribonuclease VII large subunit [Azohydromonas australica]|uniref:exodeoxyribonuclease VII large subunit n=1 Tax=Azohydromonas australica TaxID=364039 RepID=UPI00040501FA|nr:exodeoxyribonuclease VII large subunit [Azohydromonas australica]